MRAAGAPLTTLRSWLPIAAALMIAGACHRPKPPTSFTIVFSARADDGTPLEGVEFRSNGDRLLGQTGAAGSLTTTIAAVEGTTLYVRAVCPAGYRSPDRSTLLTLRTFDNGTGPSQQLSIAERCRPTHRRAAIIVSADGRAGIPVMLHNREIARTDKNGIAHVVQAMPPNSSVTLTLDTTNPSFKRLRPQNPSQRFQIGDQDTLFAFKPDFAEYAAPAPVRRKRKAGPPPKRTMVRVGSTINYGKGRSGQKTQVGRVP